MQSRARSLAWLLTYLVTTAGLVVATLSGGKTEVWIAAGVSASVSLITLVSSSFVRVLLESLRNPREATRIERAEDGDGGRWVSYGAPPTAEPVAAEAEAAAAAETTAPHTHSEEAE